MRCSCPRYCLQLLSRKYGHPARLTLFSLHMVTERQKESGHPQVGHEMAGDTGGSIGRFFAAHCQIRNDLVRQMGIEGRAAYEVPAEFLGSLSADSLGPFS